MEERIAAVSRSFNLICIRYLISHLMRHVRNATNGRLVFLPRLMASANNVKKTLDKL